MRVRAVVSAIAGALLLALPTPPAVAQPAAGPVMDVWVMDVGQGACIVVDCPNTRASILVDCGTSRGSNRITAAKVGRWVDAKLARRPFVSLVLSHPHLDHYSQLSSGAVLAANLDQAFLGGLREDYRAPSGTKRPLNNLLEAIALRGGVVEAEPAGAFVAADPRFDCAPATVDLLTASAAEVPDPGDIETRENADSAVLRITYEGRSIVLPGDAERVTQVSALGNAAAHQLDLSAGAAVMVSQHHGARTGGSNDADWIEAWKAPVVAFSASILSTYGHPDCERLLAYQARATATATPFTLDCGLRKNDRRTTEVQSRLLVTHNNGHILIRFTPAGFTISCQVMTPACDRRLAANRIPRP